MKFIELYDESVVNIKSITRIFYEMEEKAFALRIELNNSKVFDVGEEFSEYYDLKEKTSKRFLESDMQKILLIFIDIINDLQESGENLVPHDEIKDVIWNLLMQEKGNI